MASESKKNDPRFWERWKKSGAVGGIEEALARELANKGELIVDDILKLYVGPDKGNSIIYFGVKIKDEGLKSVHKEYSFAVLASGQNYTLGQKLLRLPKEYKIVKTDFPKTLEIF